MVKRVKEDGVKFVSLQFNDVTGSVKSVDMPIRGLEGALEDGVWFDGSSVEGFARIQESDMLLRLDPDTYAVLPWSSEERRRARVFCDIFTPDGKPFEGDPRGALKRLMATIAERGWTAEWKYNRKGLIKNIAIGAVVTLGVIMLLSNRRKARS